MCKGNPKEYAVDRSGSANNLIREERSKIYNSTDFFFRKELREEKRHISVKVSLE